MAMASDHGIPAAGCLLLWAGVLVCWKIMLYVKDGAGLVAIAVNLPDIG